jgi:hypothetical protein
MIAYFQLQCRGARSIHLQFAGGDCIGKVAPESWRQGARDRQPCPNLSRISQPHFIVEINVVSIANVTSLLVIVSLTIQLHRIEFHPS